MKFRIISLMLVSLVYVCGGHPSARSSHDRNILGVVRVEGLKSKAICNFKCTRERQPICAADDGQSDFVMFENFCELKLFNCQSERELKGVGMDKCLKHHHPDTLE